MPDLQSSTCPNCGSPLDIKPGDTRIKCAYCGSMITVTEHENSTPESPMFNLTIDDQTAREIKTVGKVTAGIAISSIVLPLVITVVVLCIVGVVLFFVFTNVNSAIRSLVSLPTTVSSAYSNSAPTAVPQVPLPLASTAVPLPTPTSFATDTPFPTPMPFTHILLQDDFSSSSSGWDQVHESNYTLEYKNGAYHIFVGEQYGGRSVWLGDNYKDVSVEVDVQQTAGPGDAMIGVSCRLSSDAGGYGFEFSRNGSFGIYKYSQGSPDPLGEGSFDPTSLNASGINHIEGICSGSTLTFILNGNALMQVDDSSFATGGAGLVVRTGDSGNAGIDALFNKFLLKGP